MGILQNIGNAFSGGTAAAKNQGSRVSQAVDATGQANPEVGQAASSGAQAVGIPPGGNQGSTVTGGPGGTAPQSYVMPVYGGWSNLDPNAKGQRLGQTGEMTFQGPATDASRQALAGSLGGQARPQVGSTVAGPGADPFVDAGAPPQAPGMGQRFGQSPQGFGLSQSARQPLIDSSLWRVSQGPGRF